MRNSSVPVDTLLPHLTYEDVGSAIDWLVETFGFAEHYRYGSPVEGAQLYRGNAWIMLNSPRQGRTSPAAIGHHTQCLTVFVEDVDAHFRHAKANVAGIFEDLNETAYGERQYGAEDLEGHRWIFSQHVRDVVPEGWGAKVAQKS